MNQTLQLFSENLLHTMRGALLMLFLTLCVSLYHKRKENPILAYLFWLLPIMLVLLLSSFGFMFDELKTNEQFCTFKILADLCLIPLIGSFLLKVVIPDCINARKTLLLLAPTIALTIIHAITHQKLMLTISTIYTALIAVFVFTLIVFISFRYDRYLKNNFSNIDNKTVGWVRVVIYVFAAWYLAYGLVIKQDNRWFDSAYYLFLIVIWIFIYRYSIKHVTAFQTQELFENPQPENAEPLPTKPINDKLDNVLELYMNQERPWLNPTLTLHDLAIALNTNRTYLSEYFNKQSGTTFYDYLNSLRINYACEIFYWADGDKAKVLFFKDGNLEAEPIERIYVATVTDGEKPKRCDFTIQGAEGLPEGTYTVYALYPADGWSKDTEGYKATMPDFTSEAYQQKADGSSTHVGAGMFMKAKATVEIGEGKANSFNMGFEHLVAMVRVKLSNEIGTPHAYMNVYIQGEGETEGEVTNAKFITEAYLEEGITGSSLVPSPTPTYVEQLHVYSAQLLANNEGYPAPHNYVYIPMMPTVGLYSISTNARGPDSPDNYNTEYVYASYETWVGEGLKAGYSYYLDVTIRR